MAEYTEENILERPIPYKILRQIHLSDGGSYAVQMNLKADIDEEKAYEIIDVLNDIGLVYKVEGTDPQLYEVNYSFFNELWENMWVEVLADVPVTPVHFGTFMENYVKSFLAEEKSSSVHEMLVDDFFVAFKSCELDHDNLISADYKELIHDLTEGYEGKKKLGKHIQHGLNNVD